MSLCSQLRKLLWMQDCRFCAKCFLNAGEMLHNCHASKGLRLYIAVQPAAEDFMAVSVQLQGKLSNGWQKTAAWLQVCRLRAIERPIASQRSFYGCLYLPLAKFFSIAGKRHLNGFQSVDLKVNNGLYPAKITFIGVFFQLQDKFRQPEKDMWMVLNLQTQSETTAYSQTKGLLCISLFSFRTNSFQYLVKDS